MLLCLRRRGGALAFRAMSRPKQAVQMSTLGGVMPQCEAKKGVSRPDMVHLSLVWATKNRHWHTPAAAVAPGGTPHPDSGRGHITASWAEPGRSPWRMQAGLRTPTGAPGHTSGAAVMQLEHSSTPLRQSQSERSPSWTIRPRTVSGASLMVRKAPPERKTATGTRQWRQSPQEGHHVQAQDAVTSPPPGLNLAEAPGVCKLACGRQPAPQATPQVRR
jgi:hypothetical protein